MVLRRQGRGPTGGQSGDDAPSARAPERGQDTSGSSDERKATPPASEKAPPAEAVPPPEPATPTTGDPISAATASAPIVDLESRLRRAQDRVAWAERMFQKGYVSQAQLNEARDEVVVLKARIADWARGLDSLRDDLQEEQERLRGRIETMRKEIQRSEAEVQVALTIVATHDRLNQRRPGMVSKEEMNRAEAEAKVKAAQRDVKQAELKEVEIRLDQVARRLARIDRAKDQAKERAPNLPAPPPPPARPANPAAAPAPPQNQPRPEEPRRPDGESASIRGSAPASGALRPYSTHARGSIRRENSPARTGSRPRAMWSS